MRNGACSERATPGSPTDAAGSSYWPTPVKADARSSGRHTTTTGVSHSGTMLTDAMRLVMPHLDPTTRPHCTPGLPSTLVLNPAFVETLQGFPIGWTESPRSATPLPLPW
jgi:hypothetical protein